jgi:fumarylacetoacetase
MTSFNETYDAGLSSWVAAANGAQCDSRFRTFRSLSSGARETSEPFSGGVAIGDAIVDVAAAHGAGAFAGEAAKPPLRVRRRH